MTGNIIAQMNREMRDMDLAADAGSGSRHAGLTYQYFLIH